MRIACYADLHGALPEPVSEADVTLIAGDICPDGTWIQQVGFLQGPFSEWIQKHKRVAFIAGNHDHVFQTNPELVPRFPLNCKYLQDTDFSATHPMSGWDLDYWGPKFTIFGLPWTLPYGRWWFQTNESNIFQKLGRGAQSSNIILSHGPPYGHGDVGWMNQHAGSKSLLQYIRLKQPVMVVCGHIHEGRGVYYEGKTLIVNATDWEWPKPIIVDFDIIDGEYHVSNIQM